MLSCFLNTANTVKNVTPTSSEKEGEKSVLRELRENILPSSSRHRGTLFGEFKVINETDALKA